MPLTHFGRYEITGTLGRGAMGVVYSAHDPLIERSVAIKTVACAGLSEKDAGEFEQRFFREAKSAGRLNHPNIVTIHDVGRSDELAYIAMELLSGKSLREILDAGAPLSCERIAEIVATVADGLAYAHAQGIVHRDIKPANIMVLDNGVVKITDFGIAQLPGGSLTLAGAVLGSPKNMSPEQVAGEKADGRADIFSLGTVLYEMLTGQPPFSGDNLHATMYQVIHTTPPEPSSLNLHLPRDFDPIVARAMAKAPADRYQSASEMAADLRQFLRSTAPTRPSHNRFSAPAADTPAPVVADANPSPRHRHGLAIGLACLLLAGAAFFLWPSPPQTAASKTPDLSAQPATPAPVPAPTEQKLVTPPTNDTKPPVRATTPPAKAVLAKDWKEDLRADIRSCDEHNVFSKVICIEKARWKHCPGHWGTISDCPSSTGEKKPGQ